ncbi:unnamed protein product [Fraxinus pennsylvanica]|uniref:Calreticulin n=1 Tax=Fraxinus pennsylvanica TaxID=56036 RepID=A0AAD2DTN3_9LAMI|nr:unnamed protein product [Fraxinus pennsylvanica]
MKSRDFPSLVIAISLLFAISSAEVFFEERFDDGWENRWVKSEWKKDENMAGEWNYTSGKWNGDPNDKGSSKGAELHSKRQRNAANVIEDKYDNLRNKKG